jgi:hypothetical protein
VNLDNVTLLCVDGSKNITQSVLNIYKALCVSADNIKFNSVKYIGHNNVVDRNDIEFIQTPAFTYSEYSDFMLRKLNTCIDTNFMINVQDDGFIINPQLWTDEFLEYDYIGAPWSYDLHFGPNSVHYLGDGAKWVHDRVRAKKKKDVNLVGNGGFSLRSRKLLQETARCPFENYSLDRSVIPGDDAYICSNYYEYFVSRGIKFAPVELASRFSLNIDMYSDPMEMSKQVFGFHGHKTMIERF